MAKDVIVRYVIVMDGIVRHGIAGDGDFISLKLLAILIFPLIIIPFMFQAQCFNVWRLQTTIKEGSHKDNQVRPDTENERDLPVCKEK